MLVFVDESGDTGMHLDRPGTSAFFVVTAVIFEDNDDALACDQAIGRFRDSLGWRGEFHFSKMDRAHRIQFLTHVAQFEFVYLACVFNKGKLTGPGFKYPNSFNKYAVNLVFQNAKPYLSGATVIIDGKGERRFRQTMEKYLKARINSDDNRLIQKVKMGASHGNNLLQLADVVCGAVAQAFNPSRTDGREYRKLISHRELKSQVWPK